MYTCNLNSFFKAVCQSLNMQHRHLINISFWYICNSVYGKDFQENHWKRFPDHECFALDFPLIPYIIIYITNIKCNICLVHVNKLYHQFQLSLQKHTLYQCSDCLTPVLHLLPDVVQRLLCVHLSVRLHHMGRGSVDVEITEVLFLLVLRSILWRVTQRNGLVW